MTTLMTVPHLIEGAGNEVREVLENPCSKIPHLPAPPFRERGSAGVLERQESKVRENLMLLARKVERLAPPSHRDPERFWQDKTELAQALRIIARGQR